ncbi:MAG: Uma2 family endonuclease [Rudanella sp.]|nr:Uma2 family endonuclease [Rudanella sp.]
MQAYTAERLHTVEEYLVLEEASEIKHEYMDGRIIAMAGCTLEHGSVGGNVYAELRNTLRKKPCKTYNSDTAIAISYGKYTYPDVSGVCGKTEVYPKNPRAPKNPLLLVEVVSSSTGNYDRGERFALYRQIPTFQEYVLMEQDKPQVAVYHYLLRSIVYCTNCSSEVR